MILCKRIIYVCPLGRTINNINNTSTVVIFLQLELGSFYFQNKNKGFRNTCVWL